MKTLGLIVFRRQDPTEAVHVVYIHEESLRERERESEQVVTRL